MKAKSLELLEENTGIQVFEVLTKAILSYKHQNHKQKEKRLDL